MYKRKYDVFLSCSAICSDWQPSVKRRIHDKYQLKNIFGLPDIPHQSYFTNEEVAFLIDTRESLLYNTYLHLLASANIPEKAFHQIHEIF